MARSPSANDLRLAYLEVSRHHARLEVDQGGSRVRDLGSRTGTFVNGVRMPEAQLHEGDTIRIGPVVLTYTELDSRSIELSAQCPTADEGALDDQDSRLRLLFEISRTAFADVDPDELVGRMLDAILRVLGADRAVVALREGGERDPLRYVSRTRETGRRADEPVLSRAVVDSLLARRSVLIRDDQGIARSAMGAPLQVGARTLGFLYVDTRARSFHRDDLDFLNAIACLTAAAFDSSERYQRASAMADAATGSFAALAHIVGHSPVMQRLKDQIRRYGPSGSHPPDLDPIQPPASPDLTPCKAAGRAPCRKRSSALPQLTAG